MRIAFYIGERVTGQFTTAGQCGEKGLKIFMRGDMPSPIWETLEWGEAIILGYFFDK